MKLKVNVSGNSDAGLTKVDDDILDPPVKEYNKSITTNDQVIIVWIKGIAQTGVGQGHNCSFSVWYGEQELANAEFAVCAHCSTIKYHSVSRCFTSSTSTRAVDFLVKHECESDSENVSDLDRVDIFEEVWYSGDGKEVIDKEGRKHFEVAEPPFLMAPLQPTVNLMLSPASMKYFEDEHFVDVTYDYAQKSFTGSQRYYQKCYRCGEILTVTNNSIVRWTGLEASSGKKGVWVRKTCPDKTITYGTLRDSWNK